MIGRDSSLTDAERAYLTETIETLQDEVFTGRLGPEHFRELDENEESREDWQAFVRRAGDQNLLGVAVPQEYGGAGKGYIETALVEEAIGYTGCIVHACQASLTQHIGRTLHEYGTDYLQTEYLKPLLEGDYVLAQAFTEPTAGTDLPALQTTAERDGDRYILAGEKRFIDFAGYADCMLVPARTSGTAGDREGISLFVVDADADGVEILHRHSPGWHGFRGTDACWIRFDDVAVPVEHLVGEEGMAWEYITSEFGLERVTVSRYCLGASERALEIAANYTQAREVNDRPLSSYQGITHQLAECVTKLDAALLANTRAARLLDADGLDAGRLEVCMAKWYGNEVATDVADTSIQLLGGIGTGAEYPIERIQRDVRVGQFLGGATEVLKSIVQHDAYQRLSEETFDPAFVGDELEGRPWSHTPSRRRSG